MDMPNPKEIMMKTMNQLLKSMIGIELPENFMESARKIRIKGFTLEPDKELLTLYGQIEVEDVESLEALQELISPMLEMLKGLGAKQSES